MTKLSEQTLAALLHSTRRDRLVDLWPTYGPHGHSLDAHGEEMARQLEPSLRQIAFARVFTSPSLRARQTCELAGLAPASELAPDLQEWNYGDYEGQLSVDIRKSRPDWDVWRTDARMEKRPRKYRIAPTGCLNNCSISKGI